MSDVVKIPLTQGQFAIVDKVDGHLAQWKWHARFVAVMNAFYAERNFWLAPEKQRQIKLHNAILGCPLNRKLHVDHINGNPLDNRRENIRIVTSRENSLNRKSHREGKLFGYFSKSKKRWRSELRLNGIKYRSKYFRSQIEAHLAYLRMAKEFGLQIPPERY